MLMSALSESPETGSEVQGMHGRPEHMVQSRNLRTCCKVPPQKEDNGHRQIMFMAAGSTPVVDPADARAHSCC